ncbi:GNAT family N-acetyltransferase [uncultured Winogradskyella sp.]|uniref:GNAT family N-acetyltransferase n=1 Tax=uncultured Winogradskyella sp. TaxID=395353 RepID=UPI0030DA33EF|tara:strand:+ start:23626 stop:24099 length:474 start_codon:yes stop_codon:yes gene_type:complete
MKNQIEIRQAALEDLQEITSLFRDTIIHVNSKDYSEQQIKVWASGADDIKKWEDRINKFYFIIAEIENSVVGFAYLKNGNYFDGLFVHKDYQRLGIASKLMRIIESQVMMNGFEIIKSDVSITALPFFDNKYYNVIKKQKKSFKGLVFENYIVEKEF